MAIADKAFAPFLEWVKSANTLGLKSFKVVTQTKIFPNVDDWLSGVL